MCVFKYLKDTFKYLKRYKVLSISLILSNPVYKCSKGVTIPILYSRKL